MKAAVLYAKGDLRVEERPVPSPEGGDILLKVKSAALCGTDLRMFQNGTQQGIPRVLGHEMAGVIHRVGEGVSGLEPGMRVSVAPNMGCGTCDLCVSGQAHMCAEYHALGINLDGAFAEYVLVPARAVRQGNVSVLPDGVGFDEAAVLEALSCVFNAHQGYRVHPGDAVLIIGAGPIGIMHAKLALAAGAAKVIMNDLSADRLTLSGSLVPGAMLYQGDDLPGFVAQTTAGRGVDVCVTACPSPAAQRDSLELMAIGGRVCFFGGLPAGRERVELNTNLIHYRQLIVTGSTRASLAQYRKCLALLEAGVVDIKSLITNRYPLKDIHEAFAFAERSGGLKSVINFP